MGWADSTYNSPNICNNVSVRKSQVWFAAWHGIALLYINKTSHQSKQARTP